MCGGVGFILNKAGRNNENADVRALWVFIIRQRDCIIVETVVTSQ